jgi:hypothetical protein
VLADLLQGPCQLAEPAAHARQELQALGRELHAPAAAHEQRRLQVVLEARDVLADGRRRHVQRLGRLAEIEARGDGLEDPQSVQGQAVRGARHVKFPLIESQTLRLLPGRSQRRFASRGARTGVREEPPKATLAPAAPDREVREITPCLL